MRTIISDFYQKLKHLIFTKTFILLSSISEFFSSKARNMADKSDSAYPEYQPPTIAEQESKVRKRNVIIYIIVILVVIMLVVKYFSKFYYTVSSENISFSEWNSSAGSFWGAILGAFVAGIVTIIANYMVIHRSYRIDYHRERLEVLPVFEAEIVALNKPLAQVEEDLKHVNAPLASTVLSLLWGESAPEDLVNLCYIKNIGKGISYNFYISGIWPENQNTPYKGMITEGKGVWLALPVDDCGEVINDYTFYAMFTDYYGNKYKQEFKLDTNTPIASRSRDYSDTRRRMESESEQ